MNSGLVARALTVGLLFSRVALGGGGAAHAPIVIQGDGDFSSCNCVMGGDGSVSHPYVIGPWTINKIDGVAAFVNGTSLTKSFVLWNLTVGGNGSGSSTGIVLNNINSGATSVFAAVEGQQTTIQSVGVGILVQNSFGVVLDGGGANPNGAGIVGNAVGTINKNLVGGIDIENSSNITVRGWQMSANGQNGQPDWVAMDPSVDKWGVGAVRFFGVTNSLIDHNAANNCTSISYSLFNSSHNTVSNNTADYPFTLNFLVTDGSTYNLLRGNVASTADFIGYMVADPLPGYGTLEKYGATHDNTFDSNVSHTDGPTGTEIKTGVVPAFLGGFVVLNGTYNNAITNNQDWASTGAGFGWAQAVPAATPAGVVNYQPELHCNVSQSEGGGGVGNLNGNVWTGNQYRTIDSCLPAQ